MTTLALPERWTFGGFDLSTYAHMIMGIVGADDMPPIRGENGPWTGRSGRQFLTKLLDSRRVGLTLFVSSTDANGGYSNGPVQGRANLDALYAALSLGRQATLARLMPDGTTRSAQAECVAINGVVENVNETYIAVVQFELADPRWYGASTTGPGSQVTTTSPKDFTFTPGGTYGTGRVSIDFTGPITNPRITNNTNGSWVEWIGSVVSGQHLIFDSYNWLATNNGVPVVPNHGTTTTQWLTLDPGANALRVTSTTPGGSVIVTAYPAWL